MPIPPADSTSDAASNPAPKADPSPGDMPAGEAHAAEARLGEVRLGEVRSGEVRAAEAPIPAEKVVAALAGETPVSPATKPRTFADMAAFALSAVLSPYLVIPFGTFGIIYARSVDNRFWLWAGLSILFSTVLPVLYVLIGMARGTISDVHVMERGQRGGPFMVAIIGGFVAAYILHRIGAPRSVWGLSLLLSINGLVIGIITTFTKISVHVSVLTSTVLCAVILHPQLNPYWLLWMIPALIWGRTKRGRHSVWQGIGGALVTTFVTGATIYALDLGPRLSQLVNNLLGRA